MKRKRDYQKKSFRNPFFSHSKKNKKRRWPFFSFLILIVIFVIGLYFLNTADSLKIKKIEIEGSQKISQEEIKAVVLVQLDKKRFLFFTQSNILFFNKKAVKNELDKNYLFQDLKVKKKYFNTLVVEIKEKTNLVIWASDSKQYYLDLAGVAVKEIQATDLLVQKGEGETEIIRTQISSFDYPIIYDQSNQPVVIGEKTVDKKAIDFVVSLNDEFLKPVDFETDYYLMPSPSASEITLVTKEGWRVYFTFNELAQDQAKLLITVLAEKIQDRKKLEYIDLRFGERIFYK